MTVPLRSNTTFVLYRVIPNDEQGLVSLKLSCMDSLQSVFSDILITTYLAIFLAMHDISFIKLISLVISLHGVLSNST